MTDYQRLKTYFKSIDLSQTKISDELGVSIQYINAVLNGRDNLTITFIKKVHDKYLNLNIDWLITGRGEMIYKETDLHADIMTKILNMEKEISELKIKPKK